MEEESEPTGRTSCAEEQGRTEVTRRWDPDDCRFPLVPFSTDSSPHNTGDSLQEKDLLQES